MNIYKVLTIIFFILLALSSFLPLAVLALPAAFIIGLIILCKSAQYKKTVGITILIVSILLFGAALFFGVLFPAQFIPERCQPQTENMNCYGYALFDETSERFDVDTAVFELNNNLDDPISITSAKYSVNDEEYADCEGSITPPTILSQTQSTLTCHMPDALTPCEIITIEFKVGTSYGEEIVKMRAPISYHNDRDLCSQVERKETLKQALSKPIVITIWIVFTLLIAWQTFST